MEIIKSLLSKISSYNIFSNLLPGMIYYFLVDKLTGFVIKTEDLFDLIIICYFIGLVIGRIGSLFVEPLLRKKYKGKSFLTFSQYSDYIEASNNDEFIKELNEANNTYRNLLSCFLMLLVTKLYELTLWQWFQNCEHAVDIQIIVLLLLLITLFLFSYRKQTNYITSRVSRYVSSKKEGEE